MSVPRDPGAWLFDVATAIDHGCGACMLFVVIFNDMPGYCPARLLA